MRNIEISFVITVFNKESQIGHTIDSILKQVSFIEYEFIFVNDASTDNSIQAIEKKISDNKNYIIINNKKNVGPSISLNTGCNKASGKYLFLIDGDDILLENALNIMLLAIKKEKADFLFGFHKPTRFDASELSGVMLAQNANYQTSDNPLNSVLKGKYVRMAYLVTKELYLKSGGADERIFIQDESLPLRLAYNANKLISLDRPAVYAPKKLESLSDNKLQQLHDRFYAYYFAYLEFNLANKSQKLEIYRRAISTIWKAKKKCTGLIEKITYLAFYLRVKMLPTSPSLQKLKQHKKFIDKLENVRKVPYTCIPDL